ncbi:MAG TPA: hypothetical protein PK079_04025 [Leptospiraceae bacterium]|nr:hypothetical protein [Leptospiraceae bacterium]HMW03540.1 hypothetical protein [Leptospiraceae bacterium]HMX35557.1 hypothetical protein [Leptospiraceae bacterium]HMY29539.1 hypothetical protein [Leptospiraceae bacterium]HMZ64821.1 hypothetical protein [Leptospiraceae bacterium]
MKHFLQDFWATLPEWYAKPSAALLFILLLILIWKLPVERIYEECPSFWKDLRIWSSILLVVQMVIYFIF